MKANEVQIGESYEAKVGPRWVEVEIVRATAKGGFEARGANGKPVKIKDAGALRPLPVKPEPKPTPVKAAKKPAPPTVAKPDVKAVVVAPAPEQPAALKTGAAAEESDLVPLTQVMKQPPARAKQAQAATERPYNRSTGLDGAVKVLQSNGEPLCCLDLMNRMLAAGYWKTSGKTPSATLNSALHREIKVKGTASRFVKTGRGLFALNPNVTTTEGK